MFLMLFLELGLIEVKGNVALADVCALLSVILVWGLIFAIGVASLQ